MLEAAAYLSRFPFRTVITQIQSMQIHKHTNTYLNFSSLCRRQGRKKTAGIPNPKRMFEEVPFIFSARTQHHHHHQHHRFHRHLYHHHH